MAYQTFADYPVGEDREIIPTYFEELQTAINLWLSKYGKSSEVDSNYDTDTVVETADINDIIEGLNKITEYINNTPDIYGNSVAQALGDCGSSFHSQGCVGGFSLPNSIPLKNTGIDKIEGEDIDAIIENLQEQQDKGCADCNNCNNYSPPVCNACFDSCYSYSGGQVACSGDGGYNHCNCGYNGGSWSACHGWDGSGSWCKGPSDASCPSNGPYSVGNCISVNNCSWCNNYNHNGGTMPSCACGNNGADTRYNFTARNCTSCYEVGYRYPW